MVLWKPSEWTPKLLLTWFHRNLGVRRMIFSEFNLGEGFPTADWDLRGRLSMSFHVFPTLQPDYCSQIATDMSYVTFAQFFFLLLLGRYALKKIYTSILVLTGPYTIHSPTDCQATASGPGFARCQPPVDTCHVRKWRIPQKGNFQYVLFKLGKINKTILPIFGIKFWGSPPSITLMATKTLWSASIFSWGGTTPSVIPFWLFENWLLIVEWGPIPIKANYQSLRDLEAMSQFL